MKAAIYARVSTTEQAERGYSLPTQLDACRKAAQELGATSIDEYIDDGYSGEFLDRPDLTRLRDALKQKEYDAVIIYDPDRLARNLAHQLIITEEIEKSGAMLKFVSVTFEQSPEGKLFYSIRGAVSDFEKEKIKERTMRGKRGKASKGKPIMDGKPYGYTYDPEQENYIINEDEAQHVRMMYELIVEKKMGTAAVCKVLNDLGLATKKTSSAWTSSTVHKIVTDTRYKGTFYSMKYQHIKTGLKTRTRKLRPESEWIPITVPAIVPEELWDAAQHQLHANKSMAKRNLRYDYLLNGLVYCAKCGRRMGIGHSGGKNNRAYYVCNSHTSLHSIFSGKPPCGARRIPTDVLDDLVFTYLLEIRHKPKVINEIINNTNNGADILRIKSTLARLDVAEKKLAEQRKTILKWFNAKKIEEDEADKEFEAIRQQTVNIQQHKKRLQNELQAFSPVDPKETVKRLKTLFTGPEMSFEQRREAVLATVDQVFAERVDDTWAKMSQPEINIKVKLL